MFAQIFLFQEMQNNNSSLWKNQRAWNLFVHLILCCEERVCVWSLFLKVNQLFLKCQHSVCDWLKGEEVEAGRQLSWKLPLWNDRATQIQARKNTTQLFSQFNGPHVMCIFPALLVYDWIIYLTISNGYLFKFDHFLIPCSPSVSLQSRQSARQSSLRGSRREHWWAHIIQSHWPGNESVLPKRPVARGSLKSECSVRSDAHACISMYTRYMQHKRLQMSMNDFQAACSVSLHLFWYVVNDGTAHSSK